MLNRVRVISSHSNRCRTVSAAFAEGANAKQELVHQQESYTSEEYDSVALYGLLRGLGDALEKVRRLGKDWLYMDRGYLNARHYTGYYSVTVNAFQHSGAGLFARGEERLKKLKMKWAMEPMKPVGKHILVLPPTFVFGRCVGIDADEWLDDTIEKLLKCTDRPIVVRQKPNSRLADGKKAVVNTKLAADLKDCHAVVTYNSKAAIECIVRGYPVLTCTKNCASDMASSDLSSIEIPFYKSDRRRWLATLAANQFTLHEMKSGYCLDVLREDLETGAVAHLSPDEKLTHFFA